MTDSAPATVSSGSQKKPRGPRTNIVLFFMTVFTVFLAGSDIALLVLVEVAGDEPIGGDIWLSAIQNGAMFMGALMSILLAHEFGHYFMARRNKIDVSLPYFIPLPPPFMLGTMGAVIAMRERIKSRNALMEVGAAGPICGMMLAIPLYYFGLTLSPVLPLEPEMESLFLGDSLLGLFLGHMAVGPIPEGHDVFLHPIAMAGWVGFLVTMLNMLPVGQLDGGHVFFALFGNAHTAVSKLVHKGLFVLGAGVMAHGAWLGLKKDLPMEDVFYSALPGIQWFVLGTLLAILHKKKGFRHPPTDDSRLSTGRRVAGIICLVIFVLTFMPVVVRPML